MQHHEFYEGGADPSSFDVIMQQPRIKELMLEAVKKPLTALVANVGSGKTQAASTLYEISSARIMWLQQEKGMLLLITHDDLSMTHTEILEYYTPKGITVSEQVATDILGCTDGWLFAVYVIGLSLKKGIPYGEYLIGDGVLDIFGLIESDIYRPMPPNHRRFLLKLSILESASPGLMRALADDVHETVAEGLRWKGILLRLNASTGRYQIMNLFREFMLARHNDLNEGETQDLYETAARWCEENGNQIEAIQYYKACGNF